MKFRSTPSFQPALIAFAAVLAMPTGAPAVPEDHAEITNYVNSSTCMNCHPNRHRTDLMATSHWTWNHEDPASGQVLGKKNVINNFCVAVSSNEARCTSCHIGVGWTDMDAPLTNADKIDCLVCHDTTGTYKKEPKGAGAPVAGLDLTLIAQNAGKTSRQTCGACHFYGGGGDAVKHGDLDSTIADPTREVDVHMGIDGGNFTCANCHSNTATSTNQHDFIGTRYPTTSPDHELCQKCHTASPHDNPLTNAQLNARLNGHADRVSCQACHIPAFARGGETTKESWDWSTAGDRNPDGSQKVITDADGNVVYDSMKGNFSWKDKVVPEYRWFNGAVDYVTLDTVITPGEVLAINQFGGDKDDSTARLFPVKRFTGRQPYDAGTGKLAVPHLFPSGPTDTDAYWKGYNWTNALVAGQASVERTYVGPMGVVDTEMFWIQNHMVAPKEKALACADCHSPGSRVDFAALGYPAEQAAALQSFFPIEAIALESAHPASGVTIRWNAKVNYFRYQVQSSDDLNTWTDEPDGKFISESVGQTFVFSKPGSGELRKFYRVVRTTQ